MFAINRYRIYRVSVADVLMEESKKKIEQKNIYIKKFGLVVAIESCIILYCCTRGVKVKSVNDGTDAAV